MSRDAGSGESRAPASGASTPSGGLRPRAWITRDRVLLAIQLGLVAALAYFLGTNFTRLFHGASANIGGLWCAITGIAALNVTRQATWHEGTRQILGTAVGVVVGGLVLSVVPFSPVAMGVAVGITVLLCEILRISDTTTLAATSVVMIMVISHTNPDLGPLLNSVLRFCEACIGVGIALVMALLPLKAKNST